MFDFTLYYLEFDSIIGPKIEKVYESNHSDQKCKNEIRKSNSYLTNLQKYNNINDSNHILNHVKTQKMHSNDNLIKTIKNNAFPESIRKLNNSEPHFFTFVHNESQSLNDINSINYCYTLYMSVYDNQMKRNYHQFSYVIVTKLCAQTLFKNFLISTFNSFKFSFHDDKNKISFYTNEIFDVLYSFLKQWQKIITISINKNKDEIIDFPLIDKSIKAKITKNSSKKYEINLIQDSKSVSFFDALNLDKIKIVDQNCCNKKKNSLYNQTIKLILECLLFNKNILVIGNTPTEASDAVFAISSLSRKIKPFIIPYISVTDDYFLQLIKKKNNENNFPIIVGVSNPISEFLIENSSKENLSFFDFVYYVGFDNKVGFKQIMNDTISIQSFENNKQSVQFIENFQILQKIESLM